MPEEKKQKIKGWLTKAEESLASAKFNLEASYSLATANRLYYTLYHAICALHEQDRIVTKSHKGLKAKFGEHYVLTGKINARTASILSETFKLRLKADYDATVDLDDEDLASLVPRVEALFADIKALIDLS